MKTLIINGSPRTGGDTAALIAVLRGSLAGEITEVSAYRGNFHPCVDCRECEKRPGCAIHDDMEIVLDSGYDNVVVASPVYYGILPGPLVSLMSRFQFYRSAEYVLRSPIAVTPKKGAVILTAGGKGNQENAARLARVLLKLLGAKLNDTDIVLSKNTDLVPAKDDKTAACMLRKLAERWNG